MKKVLPISILFFAGVLIVIGFIVTYNVYKDYSSYQKTVIHFDSDSKIQDLANTISGTGGILFTLAGIFLLAFTLYQTHKELNATQTILKTQLIESTFFNLMKNHKEVILGTGNKLDKFNAEFEQVIIKANDYYDCIQGGKFPLVSKTKNNPATLYKENQQLLDVGKSIVHIANLIETMDVHTREFYHTTFYYNLSLFERQLIGLIISEKAELNIKKYKYDYLEAYKKVIKLNPEFVLSYFPPVAVHGLHDKIIKIPKLKMNDEDLTQIEPKSRILLGYNDLSFKIKKIKYTYSKVDLEPIGISISYIPPNNILDLSQLFKEESFQALLKQEQPFYFQIEIECEYAGHKFTLTDNVARIKCHKDKSNANGYELKFDYHFSNFRGFIQQKK